MKKLILTTIGILNIVCGFAQSKQTGLKLGVHLMPTFSKVSTVSGSNALISSQSLLTYKDVADSVKKIDKMDFSPGFGVSVIYNLKREVELQTGVYYYQTGFVRHVTGLGFLQSIYPGGPVIYDNSFAKEAQFHYRYKYVQVPVLVNVGIPLPDINFQYNFYGTAGIAGNYLLDSDIRAVMEGFTVDNKSAFKFDSVGYDMKKFTLHGCIGMRFEYLMKNMIIMSVQPLYNFNLMPTTNATPLKTHTHSLTVAVGINYRFHKNKDAATQ